LKTKLRNRGIFLLLAIETLKKYSIQSLKLIFEKIRLVKKGVAANKDVLVTLHMQQVSAYLGMKISWC
jgi:hypothetical protein